ncbi:MAG: hypothetical protein ABI597_12700 [Gammaproteobacteria bacterium]
MEKKVKITFVLPLALQQDLKESVVKNGYSLKDKSRWVAEAIENLLSITNFENLVKLNDQMSGFEKPESVVVDRALKSRISDAVLTIRKQYPDLEGVQSRILRTAIVQRLL